MAQHDYVIDNQSSASGRADLNNLFQAIASQNSGATPPATTYANMIWYETDTDTLWKRNEANAAWISMGVFDEGLGTFTPSGAAAIATQAEAQAGTNNTALMTPLRVAQAIDTQVVFPDSNSIIFLGGINTTSGNSQVLTGLNLSGYNMLHLFLDGISYTGGSSPASIWITATGNTLVQVATGASSSDAYAVIDLQDGQYGSIGTGDFVRASSSGVTTASTSIRIGTTGTSLDAGNVRIYGAK